MNNSINCQNAIFKIYAGFLASQDVLRGLEGHVQHYRGLELTTSEKEQENEHIT